MKALRLTTLAVAFAALSLPAFAADDMPGALTGSLTFSNDYVSRGISQTSNGPAVMGSADWAFETGLSSTSVYVGAFAANVDFPGSGANLEMDFLAGLRGSAGKFAYDIGYAYYRYNGATDSLNMDYQEIILRPSYDFGIAKLSGQLNYAPDYSGDTGTGLYANARIDVPLPYEFAAFGTIGRQWIQDNALATLPDYSDWSIGLSRPIWKMNVTAAYTDTSLGKQACYNGVYGSVCDARALVSVGFSF